MNEDRNIETDGIINDMLSKNPLMGFSIYSDIQCRTVRILGREITACLDAAILTENSTRMGIVCDGEQINRGYGQFWLWVLGAYELVRTMCQAEQCFSSRVANELKLLKGKLGLLRMPFAKQELPGKKKVPVCGEPSIHGIGDSPPDFRFVVNGQVISARELISEFATVFGNITRADVLADHRTAYSHGNRQVIAPRAVANCEPDR